MFKQIVRSLIISCLAINSFAISKDGIAKQFEILRDENTTDEIKLQTHRQLQDSLYALISEDAKVVGRLYPEFPNLGRTVSNDSKLCLYTWGFPLSDRTYHYGCIVQSAKKKRVKTALVQIKNRSYIPSENQRISHDNWYGALYYTAIHVRFKRDEYYTLIGWSANSADTHFKVLDAARLDSKGRLIFGKMAFKQKGRPAKYRHLLQYDANGKIVVNYDPNMKAIVFDHLAPESTMFTDIYSYYGPDFTYDAFELVDGRWQLRENVDAKNKE